MEKCLVVYSIVCLAFLTVAAAGYTVRIERTVNAVFVYEGSAALKTDGAMARESTVDKNIAKRALARKAWHTKLHGNEYQRDLPDHALCYKGVFIMLEAKAPNGTLRPGQARNLRKIQAAGGIAEVCYNADLVDRIFDCIDRGETWPNGEY